MRKFGLIGYPLSHSFSQKYFLEKFKREGIRDALYENFPISSIDTFELLLQSEPSLVGLNVTIPYKQLVIPFLNIQDEIVGRTGACNCIRINKGECSGFNTDVTGFEQSLKKGMGSGHSKALILGSGGGSKAVEYVISHMGIDYRIASRNPDHKHGLIGYGELDAAFIRSHTLIINTTPIGMYPKPEEFPPLAYDAITDHHYLFDLVYNPEKSLFLQKGEGMGAKISNGAEMLQIQAEESWRIWNT